MHKARLSQLLPPPTDAEGTHEALSAAQVQKKFKGTIFAC